jgi:hypothetical protein
MTSIVQDPSISYPAMPPKSNHSSTTFTRVLPQGQADLPLNTASQTEILVDIPNKTFNLSKSTLDFDLDFPEGTRKQQILTLGHPISRLRLYTRTGTNLVDLNEVDMYSRCVLPIVTAQSECASHDKSQASADKATAEATGCATGNCMSRTGRTDSNVNGRNAKRLDADGLPVDADVNDTEHQYYTEGIDGAGGSVYLKYSIPLSEFAHTLLSVDKVLNFNQSLVMSVSFAPLNRIGQDSDDSTPTVLAACTMRNFRVRLAVEINSDIANAIRAKVATEGMTIITPYVYQFAYAGGVNSDSISQQVRVNSGYGHTLLNAYIITANGASTLAKSKDISNGGASKLVSIQNSVDNNLLSEYRLETGKGQDYEFQKHILQGSMLQNRNVFDHNSVQILSWRSGMSKDWRKTDVVVDGLDLSAERILTTDKTVVSTAAGYRNYVYCVVQRRLSILPTGEVVIS